MTDTIKNRIRLLMREQGIWDSMQNCKPYKTEEVIEEFANLMTDELKELLVKYTRDLQTYLDDRIIVPITPGEFLIKPKTARAETDRAFKSAAFPTNPKPFLNRMKELVEGNTDNNVTNEYKANLLILMQQTFGQMATIDLGDLWSELNLVID